MSSDFFEAPGLEYLGERLPQYAFEGFIAQGGMGAVYKACQISLERDVAIKVLPLEMGKNTDFRESFAKEAKAMARLNHPNLIGVYDSGDVEGMLYIVMEFIEGSSLHESAYNQVVEPAQAATIVKGICDGLAHAHEHGIIHRDIKPANILLNMKAEPKIGDFGLAHSIDSDQAGLVMGTPGYTAPEVFEDPDQAGPLADIYSVGVILHQLITGIDPAGNLNPPTQASGSIRLDAIWRKATQINPAMRYQSVAEMGSDLQKWLDQRSQGLRTAPASRALPPGFRPQRAGAHMATPRRTSDGSGLFLKIAGTAILLAGAWFIHGLLKTDKGGKATKPTGTAGAKIPAAIPTTPTDLDAGDPLDSPEPDEVASRPESEPEIDPLEIFEQIKPAYVPTGDKPASEPDDPEPDVTHAPETGKDLPPGDPVLHEKAIALIIEARKKRDAELIQNAQTLQYFLRDRSRNKVTPEAVFLHKLAEACNAGWLPEPAAMPELEPAVATVYQRVHGAQVGIESSHQAELNRIRDNYVPKLRTAAGETSDEDLKQRLIAQADSAADVAAWVAKLAPEPERKLVSLKPANRGFAGNWDVTTNDEEQWVADEDGVVTLNSGKWKGKTANWKMLPDGSVEVHWPDKPRPYILNPDGNGWTGKTSFGTPVTIVPGNW